MEKDSEVKQLKVKGSQYSVSALEKTLIRKIVQKSGDQIPALEGQL